jgi:hypothetical protein
MNQKKSIRSSKLRSLLTLGAWIFLVLPVFGQTLNVTCPDNQTVCINGASCSTDILIATPEAFTNCPIPEITYSYDANVLGSGPLPLGGIELTEVPEGIYPINIAIEDECAAQENCNYFLTVTDCSPPIIICQVGLVVNLDGTGTIDIFASEFDGSSYDNCSVDLSFSFSDDPSDQMRTFTCAQEGQSTVKVWLTDEAGNQSSCETFLIVQDPLSNCEDNEITLAGTIERSNGSGVEGVRVQLSGDAELTTLTDAQGHYSFSVMPGSYSVFPCAGGVLQEGLTTFDLALISGHILDAIPLSSPYQIIAADINNDWLVNDLDLLILREQIFGQSSGLEQNSVWRFIDSDYSFPEPDNPFSMPFPERIELADVTENELILDFTAIKIGDINNTATPSISIDECAEFGALNGFIFQDADQNCLLTAGDSGFEGWQLEIKSDQGSYFAISRPDGTFRLSLPPGQYEMEVSTPDNSWTPCENSYPFDIEIGETVNLDVPVNFSAPCPYLVVDVPAASLRPCFDTEYTVQYCNQGSGIAEEAYVDVTFDDFLLVIFSSLPWSSVDGQTYRFDLGDVLPGECGEFQVLTNLSCSVEPGQTHCVEAQVFPDTFCLPPNPLWDGSDLRITGECLGDKISFEIVNDGMGMSEESYFIVIEDDMIMRSEPLFLGPEEVYEIELDATGQTYRVFVPQVPGHPGRNTASLALEGCGADLTGIYSTGFFNQFPEDDKSPFREIECQENQDALVTNDLIAFPQGFGKNHLILPETDLEYIIRFQNILSEEIYRLNITAPIPPELDATTILPGASSHAYEYELLANGQLLLSFPNIALPDSNTNMTASKGFVKFRIRQQEGNPTGTLIKMEPTIYFNLGTPLLLNSTFHIIEDNLKPVFSTSTTIPHHNRVRIYPNPVRETSFFLELPDGTPPAWFQLIRADGTVVRRLWVDQNTIECSTELLPKGLYYYTIDGLTSGKIIIF